jgi:hypothetical protein
MPRFFIHSRRSSGELARDLEGQDLPGLEAAREAATATARELLADEIKHPRAKSLEAVVVTNEDGKELTTIRAKEILPEHLR